MKLVSDCTQPLERVPVALYEAARRLDWRAVNTWLDWHRFAHGEAEQIAYAAEEEDGEGTRDVRPERDEGVSSLVP